MTNLSLTDQSSQVLTLVSGQINQKAMSDEAGIELTFHRHKACPPLNWWGSRLVAQL